MIRTVARYEFKTTVKRKAYYIVTLGMPLIILAYVGLVGLITYASVPAELKRMNRPIGVIDEAGILLGPGGDLGQVAPGGDYEIKVEPENMQRIRKMAPLDVDSLDFPMFKRRLRRCDDLQTARTALGADELWFIVRIPPDYLRSGRLEQYLRERKLMGGSEGLGFMHRLLVDHILRRTELPAETIARVLQREPQVTEYELDEQGAFVAVDLWSKGLEMGIPLGVGFLLIVALMMNASLLLASVAEEKESRVVEIILSSVPADQLLFGKVLGVVAAGLLQIAIWMVMVSVIPILIMSAVPQPIEFDVPIGRLVLGGSFVVLGFVFYGCLLAGFGSMGSTYKESQQLTVGIILFACVPMMAWMTFINDPNGMVARVLSMIPLFAPIAMMLRLGVGQIPAWEVAASLVILLLSIWGAVKLSAKLFRVGTLMYGKRPGLREIWKAVRQPA